jgi:GAF domain-containing protein
MAQDSLSELIAAAARGMQGESDPQTTMKKACELGLELVHGAQAAGISFVRTDQRIDTPAATDELVRRIDELQYEHGQGPCLDAIRDLEVVGSPDVAEDDRWSSWGPAAAEETGVRSMLCFRLFTYGDTLGALSFYSKQSDAFGDQDREHGLAIAAHAAIAVAAAREIDQLRAGMDSRTVIGQAQGMLIERYALTPEAAFAVLTRVSSHSNRKLRDVAADIVETRRLPRD